MCCLRLGLSVIWLTGRRCATSTVGRVGSDMLLEMRSTAPRIISGQKETFIKRYIIERTNKAEIRPEEQSEKAESFCRENLWNEIQLKGP